MMDATGVQPRPRQPRQPPGPSARASARPTRNALFAVVAVGLLLVLAVASLAVGSRPLAVSEVLHGLIAADGSAESIIVWQLRMPRTVLAVVVGAALAVAGIVMQALTRNPLAEPGLLGVNASAAFAVVLAITVLEITDVRGYLWFALGGACAGALFVAAMSLGRSASHDHARLVLAGSALTACLAACTGVITMYDTDSFDSYRFWVVGSVADRGVTPLLAVIPIIAAGLVVAALIGPSLNALALGDEQATSLGARLGLVRAGALLCMTVLCGAATAAAGPITFVGLVVAHVLRLLVGVDQRRLLALALIVGPALVLGADTIGRVVVRPGELEAGIVTAFLGAPVLLAAVRRAR